MNNKEIMLARQQYKKIIENKNNVEDALENSFGEIAKQTETPVNIYVFIGYYSSTCVERVLSPINEDNLCARYKYYVNIETCEIKIIDRENDKEFEEKNIVFNFETGKVCHSQKYYVKCILELRKYFFEGLVYSTQEEAICELLKKNKKLVKGK